MKAVGIAFATFYWYSCFPFLLRLFLESNPIPVKKVLQLMGKIGERRFFIPLLSCMPYVSESFCSSSRPVLKLYCWLTGNRLITHINSLSFSQIQVYESLYVRWRMNIWRVWRRRWLSGTVSFNFCFWSLSPCPWCRIGSILNLYMFINSI